MKKITLIVILGVLTYFSNFGQGWIRDVSSRYSDGARAFQTANGYILFRTDSANTLADLYDHRGNFHVTKRIGASTKNTFLSSKPVIQIPGNKFKVIVNDTTGSKVVTVDSVGNVLNTIDIVFSAPLVRTYIIQLAQDGGFVVLGNATSDFPLVAKYNAAGIQEWEKGLNLAPYMSINAMDTTVDNGYIIGARLGTKPNFIDSVGMLIKLNAVGDTLWTSAKYGNTGILSILAVHDSGYIFTTGTTTIYKTDDNGNIIQFRTGASVRGLLEAKDYGIVSGFGYPSYSFKKWDESLNPEWERYYFHTEPTSIATTKDGGYIFHCKHKTPGVKKSYLIKTDSLGYAVSNLITGNVYADLDENCVFTAGDFHQTNWMVQFDGSLDGLVSTNSLGDYEIIVDTGSYTVQLANVHPYFTSSSCNSPVRNIAFNQPADTAQEDFAITADVLCPYMTVDVASTDLERCFSSTYGIRYCNKGSAQADSVHIIVEFDPYLTVDSASIPWITPQQGNTYEFNVGAVLPNVCSTLYVYVTVSCDSTIIGQSHCVEAKIFPDTICVPVDPSWDRSNLKLESACEQDSVLFRVINTGQDMSTPTGFSIIQDDVMYAAGSFQLLHLQQFVRRVPANGATWTMIVKQSSRHPYNRQLTRSEEGCGTNNQGEYSIGYRTLFPLDDGTPFSDLICTENRGAFDPNDKTPIPLGLGTEGYVSQDQPLQYIIRFQNTGTAPARTIVIRDTLSEYLDLASIVLGAASHSYEFSLAAGRTLVWTFDNIMLPDSNSNEPESHGFVKFNVKQIDSNQVSTQIMNRAAIYFDFNAPVITNTTLNTVTDDLYSHLSVSINEMSIENLARIYPNPSKGQVTIELEGEVFSSMQFIVYDLSGMEIKNLHFFNTNKIIIDNTGLDQGMYLFEISAGYKKIGQGKMVITK